MNKYPLALLPLLFIASCAVEDKKDPGIDTSVYHLSEHSPSLEGVKIPVMQSFGLDKKWGKPKIVVLKNGGYWLSYSKPGSSFEMLRIYGTPGRVESDAPEPPPYRDIGAPAPGTDYPSMQEYTQKWNTIELLGRPIHYYLRSPGGGADAPEWSTVSFCLEKPGEPTASYRIVSSSNLEHGDKIMEGYMKTVGF